MAIAPLTLTIGPITTNISSKNANFIEEINTHYSNFKSSKNISKNTIDLKINHEDLEPQDEILVTLKGSTYTIDGGEFKGSIDIAQNIAHATLKAEKSVLDSFLRVFYSILMTHHNGCLIHSAGIEKNNDLRY